MEDPVKGFADGETNPNLKRKARAQNDTRFLNYAMRHAFNWSNARLS